MRPWPWLLPAAIAGTIAALSHRPALPLGLELPPPLDKLAHLAAFAVLAAAVDWAWARTARRTPRHRRQLMVLALVGLFAAGDEWHQSFVPGRDASLGDWLADGLGAILGPLAGGLLAAGGRRLDGFSWVRGNPVRPDPGRPLILVADPHWGREPSGLDAATTAHPEADWLFLGDVFDAWVALPNFESEPQRRFLAWVDARRGAGRWVGLWAGNRDFFLDRHAGRFDLAGEGLGGELPGEGLAFEHGDLVNGADRAYRAWNSVARSGVVWLLARLLPPPAARALARDLERRLRTANRNYKLAFPEAAFRAVAATHAGSTFLTGHFHTEHRLGQGIALPWAHEGRFMVWRQGRVEDLGV